MSLEYRIFRGDSADGPVDYAAPVATVTTLTWTGSALPLGSTTRFAVRARDTVTGLTELNTDAVATIAVDAAGADLAGLPAAPAGVLAAAIAGGAVRVDWAWPYARGPYPTGFRVYTDGGTGTVDYAAVRATAVFAGPGVPGRATVAGLADGTTCKFAVRAHNASGEERNVATATATADATPPANVQVLTATPTSRARR